MALKKSELYSSLWSSCDELRGGMDASQYKDYVLVLLFIKYVSDKYAGVAYAPITIPPGASFKDMVALKGTPDIGDHINKKIIAPLANANNLSDMPDFNEPSKLGSVRPASLSAMLVRLGIRFTRLSHSAMVEPSSRSRMAATLSTVFNFALSVLGLCHALAGFSQLTVGTVWSKQTRPRSGCFSYYLKRWTPRRKTSSWFVVPPAAAAATF
jgi:hypothetical protein